MLTSDEAENTRGGAPAQTAAAVDRFRVLFHLTPPDGLGPDALAREIAIEQTVEIPEDCVPSHVADASVVGAVEGVAPLEGAAGRFAATVSFRADLAGDGAAGLLNVLYGNISLRRGIRIVGVDLTASQLAALGGPQFGIAGLRAMLGVADRPLTATAIKPLGLAPAELAVLAGGYARGGIDVVKDDHGMIDQPLHPFEERVARCQEAVERANAKTGGRTLYAPMVAGRFERLEAQFAFARAHGVKAVLAAPMLIGADTVRALARRHGLAVIAHPTFTGTHFHDPAHGISPAVLLGTLFRVFGADASIFPNAGGRFNFTADECRALADALRAPLGPMSPALPMPAGGMAIDRVGGMIETFGDDVLLLIGGALMRHSRDPEIGAAAFRAAVEAATARRPARKVRR